MEEWSKLGLSMGYTLGEVSTPEYARLILRPRCIPMHAGLRARIQAFSFQASAYVGWRRTWDGTDNLGLF